MKQFLKKKTPRNKDYLKFINTLSCCMCHTPGPCESAHVRIGSSAGIGQKPSDYRAVPLCHRCHAQQHAVGERTFWESNPFNERTHIINCLRLYIDDDKQIIEALSEVIEKQ